MSLIKKRKSEIDQHLGELEGFEDFGTKENQPEPKPEKIPKSVKPLSKKHFQPILDEVKSFKPALDQIQAQLTEMKNVMEQLKAIRGNPESNNIEDFKKPEFKEESK